MKPVNYIENVLQALSFFAVFGVISGKVSTATAESGSPVSVTEATAIRLGKDSREPWRPHAITLKPAKWIWLPSQRTLPNSFVLFRKEVDLPTAPTRADGWIAADSRYKLTVNGVRVRGGRRRATRVIWTPIRLP